jgi:hypothetical protein
MCCQATGEIRFSSSRTFWLSSSATALSNSPRIRSVLKIPFRIFSSFWGIHEPV